MDYPDAIFILNAETSAVVCVNVAEKIYPSLLGLSPHGASYVWIQSILLDETSIYIYPNPGSFILTLTQ
jgi:hypothetical protein